MTRERIIELLDLVTSVNDKRRSSNVTAGLDVRALHVEVNVFYHDKKNLLEHGVDMYSYTDAVLTDRLDDGIRTVYDPELKKAEAHLRRIINDVDR